MLAAVDGLELTGQAAVIDPLGDVDSGSVQYTIWIDIDNVAEDLFLPLGSTANVTIQVEPVRASLAVPITAIQNDDQGEYLFVIQDDGSTKRVAVVSSTVVGDLVIVTGDLKEGDSLAAGQSNDLQGPGGGPFGGGN